MGRESFIERHSRADLLKIMINGFSPAFNPADTLLTISSFTSFLTSINTINVLIATQEGSLTTSAETRSSLVKTMKKRGTQIVGRLKSNEAWVAEWGAAKLVADRLRGMRAPKGKGAAQGLFPEASVTRGKGGQAFAETALLFEQLMGIASGAPNWSLGVPVEISPTTLTTLLNQLKSLNTSIATLQSTLKTNRQKRQALYTGPKSLQVKFQALKNAVKGQYGQDSAEAASVRGVKW